MGNSMDTEAVLGDLAPTGEVRAAINVGNPVLAGRDAAGGEPHGVSVDIAREVGRRLGMPVRFDVLAVRWPPGQKPEFLHLPNAFPAVGDFQMFN